MHKNLSSNSQENIKSELEFRVWFRDEFGIDYQEAIKTLKETEAETERRWHQLLVSNGVIK